MEHYEDGYFTYFTNDCSFAEAITFAPNPFSKLLPHAYIGDLLTYIDESKHFGLKISFG